jgi:hypothetical protein
MRAISPTGASITGTSEILRGEAYINPDSFRRGEDGTLDYDWQGSTEVDWDGQQTETDERGQVVFIDADGAYWPADKIQLIDEEGEGEGV